MAHLMYRGKDYFSINFFFPQWQTIIAYLHILYLEIPPTLLNLVDQIYQIISFQYQMIEYIIPSVIPGPDAFFLNQNYTECP